MIPKQLLPTIVISGILQPLEYIYAFQSVQYDVPKQAPMLIQKQGKFKRHQKYSYNGFKIMKDSFQFDIGCLL